MFDTTPWTKNDATKIGYIYQVALKILRNLSNELECYAKLDPADIDFLIAYTQVESLDSIYMEGKYQIALSFLSEGGIPFSFCEDCFKSTEGPLNNVLNSIVDTGSPAYSVICFLTQDVHLSDAELKELELSDAEMEEEWG